MKSKNELAAKDFIQKVFIEEIGKMIDQGFYQFSFVLMSQALETLGSFLDSKPLKAKDQSKLRFSHAINRLMPNKYSKFNDKHAFYDQLRASLAHTFTTSRQIILTSKSNIELGKKHLENSDNKLVLVVEDFYSDFKKACSRLFEGMDRGIISEKKINTDFYYNFD